MHTVTMRTLQCTLHPGSWHRLRQCPSTRAVDPPFQPSTPTPLTSRQRGAFAAADKSAERTIHFSNNDKKFGKKGRGRNGKGRTREIQLTNVRNAL